MKKKRVQILTLGLFLLTGCSNSSNENKNIDFSNIKIDDSNKNEVYKILNDAYNNESLNYESITKGTILSENESIEVNVSNTFLKTNKKYYKETNLYSSLFNSYSLEQYEDIENNQYGYTYSNQIINDDDTLKGKNYPLFTFLSKDEYLNKCVNSISSILPFRVYEGYENISFKEVNISSSSSLTSINIDINTETKKKDDSSNKISNYYSIDSNTYFKNLYQEYFSTILDDNSSIKFISSNAIISINNNTNQIDNIKINHKFNISDTLFNASYTTTFKVIDSNSNYYSTSSIILKNEIDLNINESSNNSLLELYKLFKSLDDYYKSINYYSVTDGSASALGGLYTQSIKGYKIKNNDDYFFTNVTTSTFVKKAETRFHNTSKNLYKIGTGDNPSSNGTYGSVSKWNTMTSYSKDEYLTSIGHLMDGISNYTLDNDLSKTFKNANVIKENDYYIYTYEVSFQEDSTHIDACKEYKNEMNHMSNMGIPEFSKCEFSLYVDSSKSKLIKTIANEEYKTGGFHITSSLENYYYEYSSLTDVPSEITSTYKKLIN